MAQLSKINKSLKDSSDTCEVNVEEFIPYACHYNPNTLLTKNGELMQVIKLTGFAFETVQDEKKEIISVRNAVRAAIREGIKSTHYSVYFHTFRRKSNLTTEGEHPNGFTQDLDKHWSDLNKWDEKYTNELYLTVMIEGQDLSLKDINTLFRSILFTKELRYREEYLDNSCMELTKTIDDILQSLSGYGARRLQIYKSDGIYYSEMLSFLSKIINLQEETIPLSAVDLADLLPSHKVSFGFNTVISEGHTGKHYGAILTVKSYHEVSARNVDKFLQADQQFVITESFDFVKHKQALEAFEKQIYYQRISGDKYLSKVSGLDDVINANQGSPMDYGEHQITIMVVEHSASALKEGVKRVYDALNKIGVIAIREDIFLEDCYWAQLPGNFEFNKRMSPIASMHVGGFASLYSFPAGRRSGNYWGSAVSVFYTANNTPYFFNFHYEDNGHTFIIGPYGSGKTVLLNFLVAQAMKYNTQLYFFDHMRGAEIFIRSINGVYKRISDNPIYGEGGFNPLLLQDTEENREFLMRWFCYLMGKPHKAVSKEQKETIKSAIDYAYNLPITERTIGAVIQKFWPMEKDSRPFEEIQKELVNKLTKDAALNDTEIDDDDLVYEKLIDKIPLENVLSQWYGEGRFSYLFDNVIDQIDLTENNAFSFDLSDIVSDEIPLIPTIFYLMDRVEQALDGRPTIIVLDEAWTLIDNYAFNENIESWLRDLKSKNAIVIFATESADGAEKSSITKILARKIKTKIFLPNRNATPKGYEEVFGLKKSEYELLNSMSSFDREFLLIHNVDAVVCKLDLTDIDDDLAILASTPETLGVLESSMVDCGNLAHEWLPTFHERRKKA